MRAADPRFRPSRLETGRLRLHPAAPRAGLRALHPEPDAELRESEARHRSVLAALAEGVVLQYADGSIGACNESACRILGLTQDQIMGRTSLDPRWQAVHEDGSPFPGEDHPAMVTLRTGEPLAEVIMGIRRPDREQVWISINTQPLFREGQERDWEDPPFAVVASFVDITGRKLAEEQLLYGAYHDALTGLPNRTRFLERLREALERAQAGPTDEPSLAVLFLDLDRFKTINDSLGHLAGDELLRQTAVRLRECLRPADTVSRFGGDEFALLIEELAGEDDARRVALRIQDALALPFDLRGHEVFTSASIGIALGHAEEISPEDLLREADTAMYGAKGQGRARYEVFGAAMHARAVARLHLENDLRRALERREMGLVYQPIVCLSSRRLAGFEALLRWHHPQRGLVGPVEFIPETEENGLIIPLGAWVLAEACRQGRLWRERYPGREPFLGINISARQFHREGFADDVERLLEETGFPPRCLHLELTESTLLDTGEAAQSSLQRLREVGARIDIDDFGSGYSSLSYLRRLRLDSLKIDRSFVADLGRTPGGLEIVRAILTLGSSLGLEVIAEGIETAEQLDQLLALGCRYGQGFLFSPPLDAEVAALWIEGMES
ncbi:MAG TPA: EAL domain-containing protein [Thermoanaerobaculia bacterium]|nr:EAL domain-containing protein [Thermoanaerobaculia bacterium]